MRGLVGVGSFLMAMMCGPAFAGPADFTPPQPVAIDGYSGDAMEPFLSRDGKTLFFNNSNDPSVQTDIHFARRVTDLKFKYLGKLPGANSGALDGVPSMDKDGFFYFMSPRSYDDTRKTLWRGLFVGSELVEVLPLKGDVAPGKKRWLNMDAEISASGQTLYFTENQWKRGKGGPKTSNIYSARKTASDAFVRAADNDAVFATINTKLLEFAPATSSDERTIYFTRLNPKKVPKKIDEAFGLYVATRANAGSPFGIPQRISAITGFVEGVTVAPDDCAIYFHKRVGETFRIHRARKLDCGN